MYAALVNELESCVQYQFAQLLARVIASSRHSFVPGLLAPCARSGVQHALHAIVLMRDNERLTEKLIVDLFFWISTVDLY